MSYEYVQISRAIVVLYMRLGCAIEMKMIIKFVLVTCGTKLIKDKAGNMN